MSRPRSINAFAAVIDGIRNRIASSPIRSALGMVIADEPHFHRENA
jgi:hypothetical protein